MNKENIIDEISIDVKKFLARESQSTVKIKELEQKFSKMQNYFSRGAIGNNYIDTDLNLSQKTAFHNFIRKGLHSEDLTTKSFNSNIDNAGVLVTSTLYKQIITNINAASPMRQLASIESISTRALDIIKEDGSFSSGWIGESENREVTDTSNLRKQTIYAHEIYAQPKATQNLIDDAEINIENWLVERLSDSFVRLENEAFIIGDGKVNSSIN